MIVVSGLGLLGRAPPAVASAGYGLLGEFNDPQQLGNLLPLTILNRVPAWYCTKG